MLLQRAVHFMDTVPGVVEGGLDGSLPVTNLGYQARLQVGQSRFQGFKLSAISGGLPGCTSNTLRSCFAPEPLEPLRPWFALALLTPGARLTSRARLTLRTLFTGRTPLQVSEGGCDLLANHLPDLCPDLFQNPLVRFPRGGTRRQTQTHQDYQ